ncbi:MAG: hypothetical protein M3350_10565 [Actinomycetota bacterium]|nr:hypothetical protein [Actinomycetota bacterium]MDQ3721203.1 hypothetical protein [Actinomycetota bacterium]
MSGRITIGGSLAQKPNQAGHTWQFLQYILGFRRLGWDVLFVDQIAAQACRNSAGRPCEPQSSENGRYLAGVMSDFGLDDAYSLLLDDGRHMGAPRDRVLRHVGGSDLLLNFMGFLDDEEILGAARRRVFLDTDPGFGQMWHELGLADVFAGHDAHVTIGERIGRPDCEIPTCGLDWITTPQPVALEHWPVATAPPVRPFTSVASWRGAYGPVDYGGRRYGLRVHEFRKFADLPLASGGEFELALSIHPDEEPDLTLLGDRGWALLEPARVASTPGLYRDYVGGSKAELMVAKGMYVEARSGWFSERSICYLASGRPVLAQDTGLDELLPVGDGLLTFSTLEEAAAGVEAIGADYGRHCEAARALAEEHFDSDKVLGRLLDELGGS